LDFALLQGQTFAGLPSSTVNALLPGQVGIVGASEASPYDPAKKSHSAEAPSRLREASQILGRQLTQYDFDLERPLLRPCAAPRLVDLGDIPTSPDDAERNRGRIKSLAQTITTASAKLLLLGGDDSVPIPWLSAYEGHGSFTVLQIDAHTDWGDVIQGNPYGYGSPMRRASEMPWIDAMVQVGARGLGSGEAWQIEDAKRWGSHIVTMADIRRRGIEAAIDRVQSGAKVLVSIDCDGFDPSAFPAVNMPTPGGLSFGDVVELLRGVAAKAEICGGAIVEYVPERDNSLMLSGLTAAKLGLLLLGLMTD
jgi:agmatinase